MDIKLKYKAWIGEKHADIAHKLMGNDIETFALEFAEHLVKNCSIPVVVGQSEQLVCKGKCDHGYNDEFGNELFCSIKQQIAN
jgi:hypothetical protein